MSTHTYIHGTQPEEQARLAALNRLTNGSFVRFLELEPGMRVLEIGSGLGILAAEVAKAAGQIRVTALERSHEQLSASIKTPAVLPVRADAVRVPFTDASFDLVYARYVLEHVADPTAVVKEMRRVARRGARVAVCENDVTLIRFDPPCPAFDRVWLAFEEYQARLGGDGRIGRRLFALFHAAGLSNIELSVQPEVHWYGSPGFWAWVENIIGNVESARDGLQRSGLASRHELDDAVGELRALASREDASAVFVWNRAVGHR